MTWFTACMGKYGGSDVYLYRSKPMNRFYLIFVTLIFTVSLFVSARTVTISPGDTITINANTRTKVSCIGGGMTGAVDICDDFHSDSSCQKSRIGTRCLKGKKKGRCFKESNFGGKPNCVCK